MFIRDSRRSYRAYSYSELILITDLCSFGTPVGVTELMLIQRYLYTYWYLYLSQISRRSLQNLYLYYEVYTCSEVPVGTTERLRNIYWYCGTYSYTEVPVSTTCSNVPRDAHLCLYQTYLILIREYPWVLLSLSLSEAYTKILVGTTEIIRYRSTHRYYRN